MGVAIIFTTEAPVPAEKSRVSGVCVLALTSESVFIRVLITGEVGIRPGNMTREADTRVIKLKRLPLKSNQIMPLLSSLALSTLKRVEEVSPELNSWGGCPHLWICCHNSGD